MNKYIPNSIVKQFIFDALSERRNKEMQTVEEIQKKEMKELGYVTEYSDSLGVEACSTGVIADQVMYGEITIKEAIQEYLDFNEKEIVKNKCLEWIKQDQEIDKDI